MSTYWENRFGTMAQPPSATEQEKCDNAERALRNAVDNSAQLNPRSTRIILQGSYRNNTNVAQESDVDLALVCSDTLYFNRDFSRTWESYGFEPITYSYIEFKNDLQTALTTKFGYPSVTRGNKAFDIRANTYRVDADITPFFEYRHYKGDGTHLTGVAMFPDDTGNMVLNWPEQHYFNGVQKNQTTARRYKQVVRVLKSLMYELREHNYESSKHIIGFALECLAWNAPDWCYSSSSLYDNVRSVISYTYEKTNNEIEHHFLLEVSTMKKLYGPHQKWTRQGMLAFLNDAWSYTS